MNAIDMEVRRRAAFAVLAAAYDQAVWMLGPVDRDMSNRFHALAEQHVAESRCGLVDVEDNPEVGP